MKEKIKADLMNLNLIFFLNRVNDREMMHRMNEMITATVENKGISLEVKENLTMEPSESLIKTVKIPLEIILY